MPLLRFRWHNAFRRYPFRDAAFIAIAASLVFFYPSLVLATPSTTSAKGTVSPPSSQNTKKKLQDIEKELKESQTYEKTLQRKAENLASDVKTLQQDMAKVAQSTQNTEALLSELEHQLITLQTQEKSLKTRLNNRRTQISHVLMGIERLALRPPEAFFLHPGNSPHDTIRGAIAMRTAVPELKALAEALRLELENLETLRADIASRHHDIKATAAKLEQQKKQVATMLEQKKKLAATTEQERLATARKASELTRNAQSLRDLMATLETERLKRENEAKRQAALKAPPTNTTTGKPPSGKKNTSQSKPLSQPDTLLPVPARGTLLVHYGDTTANIFGGTTSKGIVIRTRPNAQVVSPIEGQVVFSGPFRGYGHLLILEHPDGYHILLSGLTHLDTMVGQYVVSGEPVGVMGTSENSDLYVELRRNGQPVNPLPWLSPIQ